MNSPCNNERGFAMVPFLVRLADKPDDEPEFAKRKDAAEEETIDLSAFHTRCGHPRRRDD
jgi:hypothetical protein